MKLHVPKTANVLGFFLVLIFPFTTIASQNVSLQFLDMWDFSPLYHVQVEYRNITIESDSIGKVFLKFDSTDILIVQAHLSGYYSKKVQIHSYEKDKIVYLQPLQNTDHIQIFAQRIDQSEIDMVGPNSVLRLSPISANNTESITALFNQTPGLFVKNYGAGNALKTVSLRGLGAEQTAINYDGININNKQLGLTELSLLNLQNVSKIEIYQGGNSSLLGSGAIAGGINFIPTIPTDKFKYSIYNSYGSWNKMHNGIMTNLNFGGIYHRISFHRQSSDNNFEFLLNNQKYNRLNSDEKKYQLGYSAFYEPNNILAEVVLSDNKKGIAKPVLDQVKSDDFARQKDNSILARLKWVPASQSEIQLYHIAQTNEYSDPGLSINSRGLQSKHKNSELGLMVSKGVLLFDKVRSFSKGEIEQSKINSTDAGTHDQQRFAISSVLESSIYSLNDWEFKLSGSLRWESISETGNIILPKIGWAVSSNKVDIYTSFGYNHRFPTFNELYWQPGGNTELEPEKSKNLEGGIAYTDEFIGIFTVKLDFYYNQIENMIRWSPDINGNIWSPKNISGVKTEGIELGLNYEIFKNHLNIIGNYSFSNTTKSKPDFVGDETVNNQVPFVPREMANLMANINWNNLSANFAWNYTGFRYLSYSNSNSDFLPSFNLIDLKMDYKFNVLEQSLILSLQLNNINNKQYQVMNGYPMPGRNFNCSLIIFN